LVVGEGWEARHVADRWRSLGEVNVVEKGAEGSVAVCVACHVPSI
jgi:hypothetical protein